MAIPVDDGRCFACGPDNPIGLHLHFAPEADGVVCRAALPAEMQGWKGIAHGGIAMALIDEAMAHAAGYAGHRGVTASVNIRFRKPVPLERELLITGRVASQRRNVVFTEAQVRDADGVLLVEADGKFVSLAPVDAIVDRRHPDFTTDDEASHG